MAQAKRCHAVLQLVCLGDRQHTAPEILGALQAQVQRWLTPRQLQTGMVVSDNGSNLLSALRQGRLTHGLGQCAAAQFQGLGNLLIA